MSKSSKYIDAALSVLDELGGGPIPSRVLIDAIVERGLLPARQYLYHNVLKKVRESDLFDTSQRGYVALASKTTSPVIEKAVAAKLEELPEVQEFQHVGNSSKTFLGLAEE